MTLQERIQRYLGIDALLHQQASMRSSISDLITLKREIAIHNRALARFISKLDPIFAGDEMSPERKAESDKITEAVMLKLIGEHLASRVPGDQS